MTQTFEATLHRPEGTGTWTYVAMPFDVEAVFGTRGRVPVSGTIDEQSLRGMLLPHGGGQHILVVKKEIRDELGKQSGDSVVLSLSLDTTPRIVTPPEELADVLGKHPKAHAAYQAFSYSHQKEFADWVGSAKKQATRERRAAKALDMISSGTRVKS